LERVLEIKGEINYGARKDSKSTFGVRIQVRGVVVAFYV